MHQQRTISRDRFGHPLQRLLPQALRQGVHPAVGTQVDALAKADQQGGIPHGEIREPIHLSAGHRARSLLQQTVLGGHRDRRGARIDAQLIVDTRQVGFDGAFADPQVQGDLFAALAAPGLHQHLELALG